MVCQRYILNGVVVLALKSGHFVPKRRLKERFYSMRKQAYSFFPLLVGTIAMRARSPVGAIAPADLPDTSPNCFINGDVNGDVAVAGDGTVDAAGMVGAVNVVDVVTTKSAAKHVFLDGHVVPSRGAPPPQHSKGNRRSKIHRQWGDSDPRSCVCVYVPTCLGMFPPGMALLWN